MKKHDQFSALPDCFLTIHREAKKNAGEDSYFHCFATPASLMGVFDGCGGLGARRHGCYQEKTEAYVASRLCAGAFHDVFQHCFSENPHIDYQEFLIASADFCESILTAFRPTECNGPQMRGSMVKTLPTTAAMALVRPQPRGGFLVSAIWAGDSRIYLLTAGGLIQLSVDDTTEPNPMENLYEDGILKNVICEGKKIRLRTKEIAIGEPFCVLCATDGCFGYLSTPMEFEGLLLESMQGAGSPAKWEDAVSDYLSSVAGDDYTLCLAAYGFDTFQNMQSGFSLRANYLRTTFLNPLEEIPADDREFRRALWNTYNPYYLQYIKDEL